MRYTLMLLAALGASSAGAGTARVEEIPAATPCLPDNKPTLSTMLKCLTLTEVNVTTGITAPSMLREESLGPFTVDQLPPSEASEQGLPDLSGEVGRVINGFKWFWDILEKNKPVVNVELPSYASAVPKEMKQFSEMGNWQMPKVIPVRLIAKNGMGATPVRITYSVQYSYGGQFRGHGQYLTNAVVVPHVIQVWPFYKVDMSAKVLAALNFGTEKDPIAGLQIVVTHRIRTQVQDRSDSHSYVIRGDGRFLEVMPDFMKNAVNALTLSNR